MGIVSGDPAASILWHEASDLSGIRIGQGGSREQQASVGHGNGEAGRECRAEFGASAAASARRCARKWNRRWPSRSWRSSRVKRPRLRGDDGHHAHLSAAVTGAAQMLDPRHAVEEIGDRFEGGLRWGRHVERGPRGGQAGPLARRREQPVVADALEAGRQHMQQEAADELDARQAQRALPAATCVGTHAEGDLVAVDTDDALVRDRDPMRVASQILKDRFGPAERLFGVDDPVVVVEPWLEARPVGASRPALAAGQLIGPATNLPRKTGESARTGNRNPFFGRSHSPLELSAPPATSA